MEAKDIKNLFDTSKELNESLAVKWVYKKFQELIDVANPTTKECFIVVKQKDFSKEDLNYLEKKGYVFTQSPTFAGATKEGPIYRYDLEFKINCY